MRADNKLRKLQTLFAEFKRVAICFSGGVDSCLLLKIATDLLGSENVIALLADTPSLPRSELTSARKMAALCRAQLIEIQTCEIDDPAYAANPHNRCYICKKIILGRLRAEARMRGYTILLDGSNYDDLHEERPGRRAVAELSIQSPLEHVGLTKAEIRSLSHSLGLPTADKPALACLSTRIPPGHCITRDVLARIEQAEQFLRDTGFKQLRLRDHGNRAYLELAQDDFNVLQNAAIRVRIVASLKKMGYAKVLLDLEPLVRG
jgi:pyridinium-3,5-biscarboxylic acid mononucleotide sulfurtransferase